MNNTIEETTNKIDLIHNERKPNFIEGGVFDFISNDKKTEIDIWINKIHYLHYENENEILDIPASNNKNLKSLKDLNQEEIYNKFYNKHANYVPESEVFLTSTIDNLFKFSNNDHYADAPKEFKELYDKKITIKAPAAIQDFAYNNFPTRVSLIVYFQDYVNSNNFESEMGESYCKYPKDMPYPELIKGLKEDIKQSEIYQQKSRIIKNNILHPEDFKYKTRDNGLIVTKYMADQIEDVNDSQYPITRPMNIIETMALQETIISNKIDNPNADYSHYSMIWKNSYQDSNTTPITNLLNNKTIEKIVKQKIESQSQDIKLTPKKDEPKPTTTKSRGR